MNIIGNAILFLVLFALIYLLILALTIHFEASDETFTKVVVTSSILCIVAWLGSIIFSIHVATLNEKVYVEQFNAEKATIEQSLKSDALSGAERIQLVNKTVDLNGELAKRKAEFSIWYNVYFDNTIYDNVEPITFIKEKEEER